MVSKVSLQQAGLQHETEPCRLNPLCCKRNRHADDCVSVRNRSLSTLLQMSPPMRSALRAAHAHGVRPRADNSMSRSVRSFSGSPLGTRLRHDLLLGRDRRHDAAFHRDLAIDRSPLPLHHPAAAEHFDPRSNGSDIDGDGVAVRLQLSPRGRNRAFSPGPAAASIADGWSAAADRDIDRNRAEQTANWYRSIPTCPQATWAPAPRPRPTATAATSTSTATLRLGLHTGLLSPGPSRRLQLPGMDLDTDMHTDGDDELEDAGLASSTCVGDRRDRQAQMPTDLGARLRRSIMAESQEHSNSNQPVVDQRVLLLSPARASPGTGHALLAVTPPRSGLPLPDFDLHLSPNAWLALQLDVEMTASGGSDARQTSTGASSSQRRLVPATVPLAELPRGMFESPRKPHAYGTADGELEGADVDQSQSQGTSLWSSNRSPLTLDLALGVTLHSTPSPSTGGVAIGAGAGAGVCGLLDMDGMGNNLTVDRESRGEPGPELEMMP